MYPLAENLDGNTGKILLSVEYNPKTKVIDFKHKETLEGRCDSVPFRGILDKDKISGNQTNSSRKFELKKIK